MRYDPMFAPGRVARCVVCGQATTFTMSKTDWRCIGGEGPAWHYICSIHFPPDDAAPGEFERAYAVMFEAIDARERPVPR